jgi:hypothetical protein
LARRWLLPLLFAQGLTHLFWLSPAVHSGQVAIPWMMNRGLRLFGEIWEQHAPGSSLLGAAAQALLPNLDPALLVKLLNTALALALTVLIFQLAKALSGKDAAGVLAALVWAWWEPVYGNIMLYFDTLLAACALLALLIYFRQSSPPSRRQIIAIGLLMGAATLFKQHAWLAVGIVGIWLALWQNRGAGLIYALAAIALPLLQWLILAGQGLFDSYLYWNWTFNLAGAMDGVPLDGDFFRKLLLSNMLVIPFALLAWRRERRQLLLVWMWLAMLVVLWPRFGEIHAMGHLPFTAVMSGLALARLWPQLVHPAHWDTPRLILVGLALSIGIGWLWTGAVTYIPTRLGPGAALGYDEFDALVYALNAEKAEGDTLFVLPQTDSTPQLHPRTDMPPPGAWIKGWRWYFRPDFVLETLREQWQTAPPIWVVVFSDHIVSGSPGILELLEIVRDRYQLHMQIDDIFDHGAAEVYRLRA